MTISHPITLAELLRHYRVAAGLTQEELAEQAKLSVRAVSDLERGVRRAPHKDTIALLARALALDETESKLLMEAARWARPETRRSSAAAPVEAPTSGAPGWLTPLIGRERQGAAIAYLLASRDTRLLTLTGPAGIGKTRLAYQVALDVQDTFADGFVFVPLSAISEPSLVMPTISQALDLRNEVGRSLVDKVQAYLAPRELLLVLDNFEQVVDAAPAVAALLVACPQVKVLVTSRMILHVRGEQEFAVPPLDTPDLAHLPDVQDLAHYSAIALFVRRAQAVRPTFTLTSELSPVVAAICVRLDGLPLAIELAAAYIKLLSPKALLARLDSSLSLLTRGPIDLPERQQTMRRAIAWSYDLLAEAEQRLFRRLSVFVEGWTLDAAEAIYDEDEDESPRTTTLDRLTGLVDKSLVVPWEGSSGEPRFRLLGLIREFGGERLAELGETAAIRQRHAHHFAAFAETASELLHGDVQATWFDRVSDEHANLRAALHWAQESGEIELGLHLAANLWWFWRVRGHLAEGRDWLERLLSLQRCPVTEQEITVRAEALRAAGNLAWQQGDYEPAAKFLEDSLVLYRQVDNDFGEAHSLDTLGLIADERGDWNLAVTLYQQSLDLFRQLHAARYVAMVYNNLAVISYRRQQYPEAIDLFEKALEQNLQDGDKRSIALTLSNLGDSLRIQGDLSRASALLEDSLERFKELGDRDGIAMTLNNLADLNFGRGDFKGAASLYRDGFRFACEIGAKPILVTHLEGAAELAYHLGLPARAARLLALATELRGKAQISRSLDNQDRFDSHLTLVRNHLGEAAFAAEWEAGRAMSLEEAETMVAALEQFAGTHSD